MGDMDGVGMRETQTTLLPSTAPPHNTGQNYAWYPSSESTEPRAGGALPISTLTRWCKTCSACKITFH
jgi:hypothetical protein